MSDSDQLSVLIVDDDDGMRSSLRRVLKIDGYSVDVAETATAAFNRSNWQNYFAILLDRQLPDGIAEDMLPKIRALAPQAAVLIITGNADLESTIAAMRHGAADYLLKPVEPESLRARLRGLAELKVTQRELAQRDAQLEFMVEHLPAAAAYVDIKSREVRFNREIQEISGYAVEELSTLEDCFSRLFGQQGAALSAQYDEDHHSWLEAPRRLRIQRKDGEQRVVECRGYRYDDHEVWMLHDVTDHDRHETALRIRDQAIQAANEGVVIADATRDGHPIIFVNRAFETMSGFKFADAIGRGCDLLCGKDSGAESVLRLQEAISSQQEFRSTLRCFRRDGQPFWNEISVAPVRLADGQVTHIVAVMEDVSERRQAQRQLLQSERLAAIGQVVTGLAHESRNALQRAQACLDMLSLDLEDRPDELELTNKIGRALQDLHRHYEEVRNYAAPINLERRPTDIAKLWRDTWRTLDSAHKNRNFSLLEPDRNSPADLICDIDEHRIEQVFRNIMENAIAACPDPGTLTVTCTVLNSNNRECVRISFHDNGPGFDEVSAAGVFQPFFTTRQKGTGLGMAIARRIVEAHGGVIEIVQPSVSGAEVIVTLPR